MKLVEKKEEFRQDNFLKLEKPVKTDLEKQIEAQRAHIKQTLDVSPLSQANRIQISRDTHLPNISFPISPQVRRAPMINYDVMAKQMIDEINNKFPEESN